MAPQGSDVLRRLEARHGRCCCDVVDHELVVVEHREDVPPLARTGRTLHQGKLIARELADMRAGRHVPEAHLGFEVSGFWGLEFRAWGLWFMVYDLWFMVYGLWFMVYGLWFMVSGLWFMV